MVRPGINGEDVECAGFPLEVIDRIVAAADREARLPAQ
jgi:hypothetical protein